MSLLKNREWKPEYFLSLESIEKLLEKYQFQIDHNHEIPLNYLFGNEKQRKGVQKIYCPFDNMTNLSIWIVVADKDVIQLKSWRDQLLSFKTSSYIPIIILFTSNFQTYYFGIISTGKYLNLSTLFNPKTPNKYLLSLLFSILTEKRGKSTDHLLSLFKTVVIQEEAKEQNLKSVLHQIQQY